MNEKFCVECGKKLPMEAKFCDACGKRQPQFAVPPELRNISAPEPAEVKMPEPVIVPPEPLTGAPDVSETVDEVSADIIDETKNEPEPIDETVHAPEAAPAPQTQAPPPYIPPQQPEPLYQPVPENEPEAGMNPMYILLIVFALIAAVILVGFLFAINKGLVNDRSSSSSRTVTFVEPTEPPRTSEHTRRAYTEPTAEASTEPTTDDGYFGVGGRTGAVYESGGYIAGRDIPVGEYIIVPSEDSRNLDDEPFAHFSVTVNHGDVEYVDGWFAYSMYVKLEEGDHLKVSWGTIYEADDARVDNDPFKHPGAFIVGKDVDPGTYKLVPLNEDYDESCSIYDSLDDMMRVGAFERYDFFSDERKSTITLKEGQLVILRFCKLEK